MDSSNLMYIKFENEKVPTFKQVRGKDWIYWGEKNDYPDYLIDLYMRSSTHNAIITGKVDYIIGGGWIPDKRTSNLVNQAQIENFIRNVNPEQSLNELSEEIVLDFEIFNAIPFEVIWNKKGTDFYLYHIPFNKLRTNEDESKYYYSNDWSSSNQSEEKTGLKEYEPFDINNKKGSSIFIYKITSPRKGKDPNVYPVPTYVGSTQAIETDLECSNYNLSEIKTGFSAGTILNFYNGVPDAEKKKEIERQIKSKFSGTDRAGGIIINFADGKDRGSDISALTGNDLDKRYIELKKDVRQEIFTGHKVTSAMLFGVKTEGQLGGRSEILEAYELFQNTYVNKRQAIIERIFNTFLKLKGLTGTIKLNKTNAIGYGIPDRLLEQAMDVNYVREKLGIETTEDIITTKKVDVRMAADFEFQVISAFERIGKKREDFTIIESRELHNVNHFTINKLQKEYFADKLTANEKAVIDLINKNDKIEALELSKALKISTADVEVIIASLIDKEFIKPNKTGHSVTDNGLEVLDTESIKTANVELLYSYELRSNAPKLKGVTSRPFCKKMVGLDLLYTRDEIDGLSNGFGLDVWAYKGGWYTNPNTDAPTPQCRHVWVSNVVKLKEK